MKTLNIAKAEFQIALAKSLESHFVTSVTRDKCIILNKVAISHQNSAAVQDILLTLDIAKLAEEAVSAFRIVDKTIMHSEAQLASEVEVSISMEAQGNVAFTAELSLWVSEVLLKLPVRT